MMQFQLLLLSSLACLTSWATVEARTTPTWFTPFQSYVRDAKDAAQGLSSTPTLSPAVCTALSSPATSMPTAASSPLPPPSPGLTVYHVAIGHGTQNYSCPSVTNATATPTALGAMATLYNVSCQAALAPSTLAHVPDTAAQGEKIDPGQTLFPLGPASTTSGHHYFTDATTPTFNLNTDNGDLGVIFSKKNGTTAAPPGAGTGSDKSTAVPWLYLKVEVPPGQTADTGNVGAVKEIYRVNTAGGNAPATCAGLEGTNFTRVYSAEYWFWH